MGTIGPAAGHPILSTCPSSHSSQGPIPDTMTRSLLLALLLCVIPLASAFWDGVNDMPPSGRHDLDSDTDGLSDAADNDDDNDGIEDAEEDDDGDGIENDDDA